MVFDGVRGDTQVRGDLFVAQAPGDEPQHLELGSSERGIPVRDRGWRSRRDDALAHHHVGVLGSPDERDLPSALSSVERMLQATNLFTTKAYFLDTLENRKLA